MTLLKCSDSYWTFLGQCTQCGKCTQSCPSLTAANMTLGDIAKAMLEADRLAGDEEALRAQIGSDAQLTQAVRGCFFCTSCKNTCFAHNDVCSLVYSTRVDFQNLGLIPRGAWSSVLVDEEWDIFTAYRAIHGIYYTDLTRHVATADHAEDSGFEVAFFPGCSLAAYAPELTREIMATLEQLGGKTTMVDHCCGSPLKSAGFYERAEALLDLIADEIKCSGAKQVVCVCPGCANAVREVLRRNEVAAQVVTLAQFLVEHGFKPKKALPQGELCISKSCQDRDGSYMEQTCAVLGINQADHTILQGCCGAGGAVSAYDPNRQNAQVDVKLAPAPEGSTVVTMCPTCTYTYAFRLMDAPRNIANKHYAELLFENQFDWDKVFAQLGGMWTGEYGAWLAQVFA